MPSLKIFLFIVISFCCLQSCGEKAQAINTSQSNTTTVSKKALRHAVFFKFKADASAADIKKVEEAFHDLQNHIPEIKDYEWGKNNSPEGLNDGFTHCFFVTFDSEEGRAIYLPHPKHKEFVALLGPVLEKPFVFDYWAEED